MHNKHQFSLTHKQFPEVCFIWACRRGLLITQASAIRAPLSSANTYRWWKCVCVCSLTDQAIDTKPFRISMFGQLWFPYCWYALMKGRRWMCISEACGFIQSGRSPRGDGSFVHTFLISYSVLQASSCTEMNYNRQACFQLTPRRCRADKSSVHRIKRDAGIYYSIKCWISKCRKDSTIF